MRVELTTKAAAMPELDAIDDLDVTTATTGDLNEARASNTAAAIAAIAAKPRPQLRSLAIVERYTGLSWPAGWLAPAPRDCEHVGDALWPAIANVERLRI